MIFFKRIILFFLLHYFLLGILLLPRGNFAVLPDLPKMYSHCKDHEDKDMNCFDFIKDHLVNIDCIFDGHEEGDDQKPHQPYDFNNLNSFQLFVFKTTEPVLGHLSATDLTRVFHWIDFKYQEFLSSVFKPPKL